MFKLIGKKDEDVMALSPMLELNSSGDVWLSYGLDLENRIIELTGIVAEPMLTFTLRSLVKLNLINNNPITIYLSSAGGNIFDGLAIYDLLRASPSEIVVYASGKVCSMGIILLIAGDERFAGPNTRFMMHSASHSTEGKVSDTKADVSEVEFQDNMTTKLLISRSKLTKRILNELLSGADHWFGVATARKYGILTDIKLTKPTKKVKKK